MTAFPRILVTNDDGIDAPGLVEAERIAAALADEVWTIAPLGDQSGVGQGISMHQPLRLSRYGERRYAVSGTPADCVMYAMAEFFADEPPDLVLSGVNWGANLSDSVMYSGTVGAVLAANHLGIDAIALSQAFHARSAVDFAVTRAFAVPAIETLAARRSADGSCCWNVNFPMQAVESVRGLRFTRQVGGAIRAPQLIAGADGRGLAYHWLSFERDTGAISAADADVVALRDHWVSAMPLHGTRCDEALFQRASAEGEHRLQPAAESA
ncbi:5'/3'-nucleotidase SurE [Salinisphaera orenii]|uniref:5'-nucleotidase SurE n=1 Tax=Salinisphaera orenii YIM 95161 TaxID=1051139 RepID=A0A423PZ72_9GAMM|nr:5'/3'-nucleotidase SurE [Salinisphaera halophila]ROO30813.1 acid phosphatase [Salinisphaera halophila YIM 95161]